jgi:hypothetical protein
MKPVLKMNIPPLESQQPPEEWVLKFVNHSPNHDVLPNVEKVHSSDIAHIDTLGRNVATSIYECCAALDASEDQTDTAIAILDEVKRLGNLTWDKRLEEEDLTELFGLFLGQLDLGLVTYGDSTVYTSMLKQDVLRFLQAELTRPPYLSTRTLVVPLKIDNSVDEYPDSVASRHISKSNFIPQLLREISRSRLDWVREYHAHWSAAIEALAHSYTSNQLSNNEIYPLLSAICYELNPDNPSDLRKAYWNHRPYLIQVQGDVHYNIELLRKHLLELILETADLIISQQEDGIDILLGYRVDMRERPHLLQQLSNWSGSVAQSIYRTLRPKLVLPKLPRFANPLATIESTIKQLSAPFLVSAKPVHPAPLIQQPQPAPVTQPQITSKDQQEIATRELFNKRFLVTASKLSAPTIRYVLYALARQGYATKKDPQDILASLQSSPEWQAMVTVELAPIALDSPIIITNQGKTSVLRIEKELQQTQKRSA